MSGKMKYNGKLILLLAAVLLTAASSQIALGSEFRARDDVAVDINETVRDDLYLFGNNVEVRGDVDGDLVSFSYSIISNGEIFGSANIFAYNIDLTGHISGTVRTFAYSTRINCPIEGNFVGMSGWLRIGDKAIISKDFHFVAERLTFDGTIRGKLEGGGDEVKIAGTVFGDVDVEAKRLIIVAPAIIKGNLKYTSPEEAIIEDGVVIEGKIDWDEKEVDSEVADPNILGPISLGLDIALFVMAFVTGLFLILLFKDHARTASEQVKRNFWHTLAIGFLAFIIIAGGAIVSAILLVGIPLSILLIMVGLIFFYIGKIYAAIPLGNWAIGLISKDAKPGIILQFLLGLIILTIIFQIPFFGFIGYIAAFIIGTGAIVTAVMEMNKLIKNRTGSQ